jgi:kexin
VGEWTIHVKDQKVENRSGVFHGWSMTFWGSARDPTNVKTYTVPLIDMLLPPLPSQSESPSATSSSGKTHPKPTAYLPGDHGTAPGDKNKPAFPSAAAKPSGTLTPTPDEGWFADMSNLVSSRRWFFGAVGAVAVFGIAAGVFFWKRRATRRTRGLYTSLGDEDDVAMDSIDRGRRPLRASGTPTKELYDAFGEVSDDEDDADEETGLRSARAQGRAPTGLAHHSGFLDGEDPQFSRTATVYKDEPEESDPAREASTEDGIRSPDTPSGDGSWEHASQNQ